MTVRKRLEKLEQAREGSDPRPIEVWTQDESEPHMFKLERTGERLSREQLDGRHAQIILVMYGERTNLAP